MNRGRALVACFAPILMVSGVAAQPSSQPSTSSSAEAIVEAPYTGPTVYAARIIARYPHDVDAFTQGLLWHEGALIESTGRVGQSRVRKVDLETGEVLLETAIPSEQFGEGIALWGDQFVSLTWRDGVVHRWNSADLSSAASFDEFPFEGWGLTTSEEGLIHSDGTATLRILDPHTYGVKRSVEVTLNGRPLSQLNELEWIDGLVYANVWQTGYLVAIDPEDGRVRRLIDLRAVVAEVGETEFGGVLNGIAWDPEGRRMFVTGKLWPQVFEIELVETAAQVR